jgi:hypothetical protein
MAGGYRDPDALQSPAWDVFDAVGPAWFVVIAFAAVAWFIGFFWLMGKLGWPESYGFTCRGKGCLLDDMWHSPALLRHHIPYELGLFMCIWMPAAAIIGPFAYRGLRKLRTTKLSLYSDEAE